MIYMRCKCGAKECWTSMGHPDCAGCEKCGTTLETHPSDHKPIAEHTWGDEEWAIDKVTGKAWKERICAVCLTREKIDVNITTMHKPRFTTKCGTCGSVEYNENCGVCRSLR